MRTPSRKTVTNQLTTNNSGGFGGGREKEETGNRKKNCKTTTDANNNDQIGAKNYNGNTKRKANIDRHWVKQMQKHDPHLKHIPKKTPTGKKHTTKLAK